jgi:hypothetical protein
MNKFLLTVLLLFSSLVQAQWYYGSGEAVNLENRMKMKNGTTLTASSVDPSSVATPGTPGSILWNTSGNLYIKQDSGTTTNWNKLANLTGGVLPISQGGTGVTTTPANGQLLIGNGTGYTVASITSGSGITVTNGSGTITIAATGGSSALIGYVYMTNYNGTGSTNTRVAKFNGTSASSGSITIDNSATNGFSATMNSAGVLCASFSAQLSAAVYVSMSLNASQLSTEPYNMTAGQNITGNYLNDAETVTRCFAVANNDVFRVHVASAQSVGSLDDELNKYGLILLLYP